MSKLRTEDEIKKAIEIIENNKELAYGYIMDVVEVLYWVLGDEPFDGLPKEKK